MRAKFEVYGDSPIQQLFLVQNLISGPDYNSGINADYKNPTGTGLFRVYNGIVAPVLPSSLPVPTPVTTSSSGAAVVFLEAEDGTAIITEDGIPLEVDV